MMNLFHQAALHVACLLLCLSFFFTGIHAQDRQLVWADEFNDDIIDRSTWQYESGLSNDNVQFYTDRSDNAKIVDGKLQIIALQESYQGYEYTSAHLRTGQTHYWKYGTVHTEKYNLFSGSSPPRGGMIEIPDAETAFHLYAMDEFEGVA